MNVERLGSLLPVCGDRWLPSSLAEAFTVEQPIPFEFNSILDVLELRRPNVAVGDRAVFAKYADRHAR
jgi:hypothetical protein